MERTGASSGVLRLVLGDQPSVVVLELGSRSTRDLGLAMLAVGGLAREGTKDLLLSIVHADAADCVGPVVGHTSVRGMRVSARALDDRWIGDSEVCEWAHAGLSRLIVTIAAANGPTNDARRGLPGSYRKVFELAECATRVGLTVQVETPWRGQSEREVAQLHGIVEALGAAAWTVELPVHSQSTLVSAERAERFLVELADIAAQSRVVIDTRNGPQFERVLRERFRDRDRGSWLPSVSDGRGMLCIDDEGRILPSGALRLVCGSLQRDDPLEVYRFHPTFRTLRDNELFDEPCRHCDYRSSCGGSRARAHAHTGKLLAADPLCVYTGGGATGATSHE